MAAQTEPRIHAKARTVLLGVLAALAAVGGFVALTATFAWMLSN